MFSARSNFCPETGWKNEYEVSCFCLSLILTTEVNKFPSML